MKVIVKTENGGSPFEVEVDYPGTVLMVKQKIENSQLIPVSKQTLSLYGGMPLRDEHELRDIIKDQIFSVPRLHLFVSSDHNNPNHDQTLITEGDQEQSENRVSKKKKIVVHVSLYSREKESSAAKNAIHVDVERNDDVKELRKELVKLEEKGELNLPQEGYFLKHKGRLLKEDQTFCEAGVNENDAIEIFPGLLTHGIF